MIYMRNVLQANISVFNTSMVCLIKIFPLRMKKQV